MKFICMVLMSVGLAACGGGSDDDAHDAEGETQAKVDAAGVCMVKQTPPGQPPQPMPPYCSTK